MIGTILLSAAISSCTGSMSRKSFSVVIDAGHGGKDPGAPSSFPGRYEKEANLAIAKLLYSRLVPRLGWSVRMTRTSDQTMSLADRRRVIASCIPDLVVSIHADSGPPEARGSSVYTLDEVGRAVVIGRIVLAKTGRMEEPETAYILADLEQRQSINYSFEVAKRIQVALDTKRTTYSTPISANFAILKTPGVASVLIECGFISNIVDARRLLSVDGQVEIADRIASAIAMPVGRTR